MSARAGVEWRAAPETTVAALAAGDNGTPRGSRCSI